MIESGITSKGQTTVPRAVRLALGLRAGERLAYQIDGDQVLVTKAKATVDPFDPLAVFTEWADEIDCEDFKDF